MLVHVLAYRQLVQAKLNFTHYPNYCCQHHSYIMTASAVECGACTVLSVLLPQQTVLAETVLSPAQWDLMNTIRCSGETLLTLITDILDFSRIEADKLVLSPSEFHLQTVIEAAMEIAGLHAAQKRLQVQNSVVFLLTGW